MNSGSGKGIGRNAQKSNRMIVSKTVNNNPHGDIGNDTCRTQTEIANIDQIPNDNSRCGCIALVMLRLESGMTPRFIA